MMNLQPEHIQRQEIVDIRKIENKYKQKKNLGPFNLIKKCLSREVAVIVDQSWLPITAKSAHEVVIELMCSSNIFFFLSWPFSLYPLAEWSKRLRLVRATNSKSGEYSEHK